MNVLTIDQEGVKVFTLPEKPGDYVDDHGYLVSLTSLPIGYADKVKEYKAALAQAKSSAILVKDQEQAIEIIKQVGFKQWMKNGADEADLGIGKYKITTGKVYPIPGLKVTYDFVVPCRAKGDCQSPRNNDDGTRTKCISTCKFEYRVAILSLEEEKKPERPDLKKEGQRYPTFAEFLNKKLEPVSDGETQEELWEMFFEALEFIILEGYDMGYSKDRKKIIGNLQNNGFTIQRKVK